MKTKDVAINWSISIDAFSLSLYALPGQSGVPPAPQTPGGLNDRNLAYMTLNGKPFPDAPDTPQGLAFVIYFYPDGSNLRVAKVTGPTEVSVDMNISQLASLVSLLEGTGSRCTVGYSVSGGNPPVVTIIGG